MSLSQLLFLLAVLLYISLVSVFQFYLSRAYLTIFRIVSHNFSYSPSYLSPPSTRLCLSFFEAALSLRIRGGSGSLPFLGSDALAFLRGSMLFAHGLLQVGIWESLAAGLANAVVRVSVNELS